MTDPIPSPDNTQPNIPQPEADSASAGQPEATDAVVEGDTASDENTEAKSVGHGERPGRNGGTLWTGNPGNKGGTGRPRKAWKEFCRDASEDPDVQDRALQRARKGNVSMLKLITDHGVGAPEQKITLGTDSGALERLLERLAPKPPEDTA